jgi:hypothetical protein
MWKKKECNGKENMQVKWYLYNNMLDINKSLLFIATTHLFNLKSHWVIWVINVSGNDVKNWFIQHAGVDMNGAAQK